MHAHGNHESLVYWLEFKNDNEFPSPDFGSIAGGSAHKFGLFRRKDTEQWVTGSGIKEKVLSIPDAIAIARKHRDQFVAGAQILEEFTANTDDASYLKLQSDLKPSITFGGDLACREHRRSWAAWDRALSLARAYIPAHLPNDSTPFRSAVISLCAGSVGATRADD
jgi:hypothetical protein